MLRGYVETQLVADGQAAEDAGTDTESEADTTEDSRPSSREVPE